MEVTKRLAAFAAGLSYNSIPADVRDWSRIFLLDFVGVALGAAHFFKHNGDRLLERYLGAVAPRGPCTVLGYGIRTTPTLAAFSNGALAPRQLWKERVRDRKVHELASRVVLTEDPAMSAAYPEKWPVELTLRLRNGKKITRRAAQSPAASHIRTRERGTIEWRYAPWRLQRNSSVSRA